jgi:hypothetical protein
MADDIKSKIVIENQQDVKDTLLSLAGTLSAAFKDALTEAFEPDTFKFVERDLTRSLKKAADWSTTIAENSLKLSKGTSNAKDIAAQLEKAKIQSEAINRQKDKLLKQLGEEGILASETYKAAADYSKILDGEIAKLQEQANQSEKINKNLGVTGELFNGLSKSLQKFGISSSILDTIKTKLNLAADKGQVSFSKASKIIGEELTKALEDPLVKFAVGLKLAKSGLNDIKAGFNIFLEYNKIFSETARNLGMSVEQITAMTKEAKFADDAIKGVNGQTFNTVYTAAQLTKAIGDVNNQLGLSVDLGGKTIDEFTAMTNQMGLSAEEATKIYKLGLLTNSSLQDTNKSIANGIVSSQKQFGVQVNARQVFQEIGKLSAGITTKFQQNPEALAKAVVQAKALGTNLETIDKVGDSLLDWESSIENQLKAQLLTGKQINLEQARYAALTGDQATLMTEISKQVGSLSDFTHMNVLAQRSLAQAFGLSRDELADMLQKQEVFNKLGDVSGKSAQEQLAIAKQRGLSETDSLMVNLKQQAAAEKLGAAWDSVKSAIGDVLTGLTPLLNTMADLAKNSTLVYSALGAIATMSFAKAIGGLVLMVAQFGAIAAAKTAGAAADVTSATAMEAQATAAGTEAVTEGVITGEKAAQAAASSIINPIAAAAGILLAGAAIGAIYSAVQKPKDGIAPSSKGPFTITDAYGATAVTAKGDGIAVSPNINKESSSPSFDLSTITDAISALSNTVSGLVNRPQPTPQFALHVDGKQLGTVVGKQIETGTAQNQYTGYKIA